LLVLDDQLSAAEVLLPLRRRWMAVRLQSLRPGELILDERVPEILRAQRAPTFLTIDQGFWERTLADRTYCVLYFALRDEQQPQIHPLLRRVFRTPGFTSRAERMGKVARISPTGIDYWQLPLRALQHARWR
jgi:hypothetical protein